MSMRMVITMFSNQNRPQGHWVLHLIYFTAFINFINGNCGPPPRLDFAILHDRFIGIDSFPVGTNVTYQCNPGYISNPTFTKNVTCLDNSTWSTPQTFCVRRSCGTLPEAANADVQYSDNLFGSRAIYTCHTGYNMLSKRNYRDCQADGTWSNDVPVCEVQKCTPPSLITDGSFDPFQEEYDYLNSVTYKCNDAKFTLLGEASIYCTQYGNWSSDAPKCVAVECLKPEVANAIQLSGFVSPYYFNRAVSFECKAGFIMKGESAAKCNASSKWDPPLPICQRNCGPPPRLDFAILDDRFIGTDNFPVGTNVTYQCNPGYSPIPSFTKNVTCLDNSTWSTPQTFCVGKNSAAAMDTSIFMLTIIFMGYIMNHHI